MPRHGKTILSVLFFVVAACSGGGTETNGEVGTAGSTGTDGSGTTRGGTGSSTGSMTTTGSTGTGTGTAGSTASSGGSEGSGGTASTGGSTGGGASVFPTLTYLGGAGSDAVSYGAVRDVAVDGAGNVYAVGGISLDGYGTAGAAQTGYGGGTSDAFVASFAPDGTLRFFTYLGGGAHDRAYAVEVTADGIFVGGRAGAGFPTTPGVFQATFAGGGSGPYGTQDGFLAKLSLDGGTWAWVTYVGGDGPEVCRDLAVDVDGDVYCSLIEIEHPIGLLDGAPGAFQPSYGGGPRDHGLVELSADGTQLLFGTYIGGTGREVGATSVRPVSTGGVYFVGSTESSDAPVTVGAYQTIRNGKSDVLLMRIGADGGLLWATYYGGSGDEGGETHNLAVAGDDTPIVAMFTNSNDLPGAMGSLSGSGAGFVARFSAGGDQLLAARYLGGNGIDEVEGIDADADHVVVSGGTNSAAGFPSADPDFPGVGGDFDGHVVVFPLSLGGPIRATRIPGAYYDWTRAVALGPTGTVAFGGESRSLDLPVTANAFEAQPNPALPTAGPKIVDTWGAGFVGWIAAP